MAYMLSMDNITFYPNSQLMRQMGHTQGLSPAGAFFEDTLISPQVTVAVLGGWSRGAYMVEAIVSGGRIVAYEAWWILKHGDWEREHKATLTWEIDTRL
ncbi:hypothetical protein JCGZ_24225 [Jatropha curcas]|uniref:Uncharacterized protein n=1 Tax=Jatropha curcas TaxID=180498 RepID=A0A067LGL9_JATCU|nr:hypothetical protein JCGZ_24225 [Jatropha curcas]